MKFSFFKFFATAVIFTLSGAVNYISAADPTDTDYTFDECRGSAMPYPAPESPAIYPDSLTPLFISHVGRHGSRYPASSKHVTIVTESLYKAATQGSITAKGKKLLALAELIAAMSDKKWGALDSLGMAEQRGIASRMYSAFPELFNGKDISAISSYSPRCVMSMYSFLHQLTRLDNKIEITARSGRQFSRLMRFFDTDTDYSDFVKSDSWRKPYNDQLQKMDVAQLLRDFLGESFQLDDVKPNETLMAIYSLIAGTAAISLETSPAEYFSQSDFNSLWQVFNLRQYLLHSASTLSTTPSEIASPLLLDIIGEADHTIEAIKEGRRYDAVQLRFGHAETLMPLYTLMHLDNAYYLTNYFDTVGKHWHDFALVPMAANLQMIFFQTESGKIYVRCDVNERTVAPIQGDKRIYIPWTELRAHFERYIPIYRQL